MKRCLTIALYLALGGCAGAAAESRPATTIATEVDPAARDAERARLAEAQGRARELETQLALTRSENDALRDRLHALEERSNRQVTRIAAACEPAASEPAAADSVDRTNDSVGVDAEPVASGPRPVLRLYGPEPTARPAMSTAGVSAIPGPPAPAIVAAPPAGAARLPVFTSGSDPSDVPAIPLAPVAVAGEPPPQTAAPLLDAASHDRAVEEYQRALRALSERRLQDAIVGLDAFVRAHPGHPYADNAMYWRAEITFTRGDYDGALAAFSRLIERYPRGNKVPDALLRIARCYERLGRHGRARRVFERLRAQYPESSAARRVAREDA